MNVTSKESHPPLAGPDTSDPPALRSDPEDLLDIKQAARYLQVSETSLRRWTNGGQLACLRVGLRRERRFRRADLLAFMEYQPATNPAGERNHVD
jgi:excisionase family DNA binding protein